MKLLRSLAIVACAGSMFATTGCGTMRRWFGIEDAPVIEADGTSMNDFGPGMNGGGVPLEVLPTEPSVVVEPEGWTDNVDAIGAEGEWQPIAGRLGFPVVYFAYDKDSLGSSEVAKLESVAAYMNQHSTVGLIIEGHCDERGSVEYNRALGERRAISVKDYLLNAGITESRIQTLSFGEEKPAVMGTDTGSRSKNRRAELIPARM